MSAPKSNHPNITHPTPNTSSSPIHTHRKTDRQTHGQIHAQQMQYSCCSPFSADYPSIFLHSPPKTASGTGCLYDAWEVGGAFVLGWWIRIVRPLATYVTIGHQKPDDQARPLFRRGHNTLCACTLRIWELFLARGWIREKKELFVMMHFSYKSKCWQSRRKCWKTCRLLHCEAVYILINFHPPLFLSLLLSSFSHLFAPHNPAIF